MSFLYLDHAATSFPKAPGVAEAVAHFLTNVGANPGRSAHRLAIEASRVMFRTREAVARLFDAPSSERVVFCSNVTEAINMTLQGFLREGDHVVTTAAEHNALKRPLLHLERCRHLDVTVVETSPDGQVDPRDIHRALRPSTRLVAMLHASNVTGTIRDLAAMVEATVDVPLLLDTAQSAGAVPISLRDTPVEFLAFTGHKGLLGPTGTGGLVIGPDVSLEPLVFGGTGSNSKSEEQPDILPNRFESGTQNAAGLAGLLASVTYLLERGVATIRQREATTCRRMVERLGAMDGVTVHGSAAPEQCLPTVSVTARDINPSNLGLRLDREADVLIRVGLHCSPSAHRQLGTWPEGTVRLSAGPLLSNEDLDRALDGLEEIVASATTMTDANWGRKVGGRHP